MPRHEAIKALEAYKRAGQQVIICFLYLFQLTTRLYIFDFSVCKISELLQAASLSDFYEVCKGLELARNFQFPVLREVCLQLFQFHALF
jgi:hypothetical protein